jgi:hypothetical protein
MLHSGVKTFGDAAEVLPGLPQKGRHILLAMPRSEAISLRTTRPFADAYQAPIC